MLPDMLAQAVREAGGEALILDARRGRALLTDSALIERVAKELRALGFTRCIDFTAQHLDAERFSMSLVLRNPAHAHASLVLKWTFNALPEPAHHAHPADKKDEPQTNGQHLPEHLSENGHMVEDKESSNGASADAPGEKIKRLLTHPSLARIWPAAGLAERELFEMLGIVFAGNENLTPLLLSEQFAGFPLRRDYAQPAADNYAERLLNARHNAAVKEQLA